MQMVGGKSLLQRAIEQVRLISDQILVIGSPYQRGFPADSKIEYREDLYPGKGPLGGIYTGLFASKSDYNLVVACDLPFLNVGLLRYLIKLSPGFDAVVPRVGKVQPLHAVYSRACVDAMGVQVKDDRVKITWFLDDVKVRYIEEAECQDLDPGLLSFFNVNSRADLARANTLIEENASLGNKDKL